MPYSKFTTDDMIMRDHLARDRTVLANERTLLAYVRTAIALFAAGGTLLKFFPAHLVLRSVGGLLLATGLVVVVLGIWRFTVVASRMRRIVQSQPQR